MKITSVCAVAALLLVDSASAWKITIYGKDKQKLVKEDKSGLASRRCFQFAKHDFETTKVSYSPVTNMAWTHKFGHFTLFESDNCVTGNGYAWFRFQGYRGDADSVTFNLRTPFKAKSFLIESE
jgi:hypothetical protein